MNPYGKSTLPLRQAHILVVDDEILIALTLEEVFHKAGAEVTIATTAPAALEAAMDNTLSAALLDVRLGDEFSLAAAERLARNGVPFLFYSGQNLPAILRTKFPLAQVVAKPAEFRALIQAMSDLIEQKSVPLDSV